MITMQAAQMILPIINIGLSTSTAVAYLFLAGDIRHAVYWAAAAVITAAVTF